MEKAKADVYSWYKVQLFCKKKKKKKKKKKAEQNLQESAIFVKLLAHTCNLRKNRTLLQMFCL